MFRDRILKAVVAFTLLHSASPIVTAQDSFLRQSWRTPFLSSDSDEILTAEFPTRFVSSNSPEPAQSAGYTLNSAGFGEDEHNFAQSASYPAEVGCVEDSQYENQCSQETVCDIPLVRFRKSFFQGAQASYGTVNDDPDLGLKIRTVDTSATFAVPLSGMENIVTITPYIRADFVEAAAIFDVPEELFDTGVKLFWKRPINDRLGTLVLITPSVRSDFTTSEGAFRIFGMGLLTWSWIPEKLSISGGVVHTGRDDFPVLPAMGLLWTPTPEWKFDAQFPSPRISYRLKKNGGLSETWVYLAGVFGGNTWAITRAGGASDELTIRDLRLVTGIEYVQAENRGFFLEAGYVFNRSFEYTSNPIETELESAMMMRAGISF